MPKYIILENENSAGLIEEKGLEVALKSEDPEDPSQIVKEFEADCWCAANQVFASYQGYEAYDMHFCEEKAAHSEKDLCPFYEIQQENREKLSLLRIK